MSNRLAQEHSRYLQQHAQNPVDWFPWGQEALRMAQTEEKPIFLSIGYSSCHWCHVMAHESFEDVQIAELLNTHFVSIKVDREERPDLDRLYMEAVQALTGNGGWPMSVFLFPDGTPFYGGTYFPPQDRFGLPSFRRVLLALADAWETRRDELAESGQQLVAFLERDDLPGLTVDPLTKTTLQQAVSQLRNTFDDTYAGWGAGPKFPQPMVLDFLLRYQTEQADPGLLGMVTQTLEAMARGGIYDQLGGGFHRYAVDGQWLVPHFEKMLYDNAQLARVYLHGWQVTGEPLFRAVVEETLDYILREMRHPAGGFFATQDADSEGKEGQYFVWSATEIRQALGERAEAFMSAYGVSSAGNFEGHNILNYRGELTVRDALTQDRLVLRQRRQKRIKPGRDEKVLASWNGLMLRTLAEAGLALGRKDYTRAAEENAAFLLDQVYVDGQLHHVWQDGQVRVPGFAEDYALVSDGLLALYEATSEPRWYGAGLALTKELVERFSAPVGFFDTPEDAPTPLTRRRDWQDNAVPSANAVAAGVLLRLSILEQQEAFAILFQASLREMADNMAKHPLAFGQWLIVLDSYLATGQQVVIVGAADDPGRVQLLAIAHEGFHPHRVVLCGEPEEYGRLAPSLLQGHRLVHGQAAAFICSPTGCLAPVTDPTRLRRLLNETVV